MLPTPRRHLRLRCLILIGCFFAGPGPAAAVEHEVVRIELPGTATSVAIEDTDGDGKSDLIISAFRRDSDGTRRFVSIVRQNASGFAAPKSHDLAADVAAICIDNLVPGAGLEIATLTSAGLDLAYVGNRWLDTPQSLLQQAVFFAIGDEHQVPRFELLRDLNRDAVPDIFLPTPGGYVQVTRTPDGWRSTGTYSANASRWVGRQALDAFTVNARIPALLFADHNGDRRDDLLLVGDRRLNIHHQRANGSFDTRPDVSRELGFLDSSRRSAAGRVENHWVVLENLDDDPGAEMIVSRQSGKLSLIGQVFTRILVFDSGDGLFAAQPRQPLTLNGVSMPPELIDIDGDGARDLLVSSIRMDMMSNLKKALFKNVQVTYHVFRNLDGRGVFAGNPEFSKTIRFSLDSAQLGLSPLASLAGDFTGDGVPDLLTLTETDRFCVYHGKRKGGLLRKKKYEVPSRPSRSFNVAPGEGYEVADVNHDGIADVVVFGDGGVSLILSRP